MQELIGWAWQNLECERLGITIEDHNQLVEAAAEVAAATRGDVSDVYRSVTVAMGNIGKSASQAAAFLEDLTGAGGGDG